MADVLAASLARIYGVPGAWPVARGRVMSGISRERAAELAAIRGIATAYQMALHRLQEAERAHEKARAVRSATPDTLAGVREALAQVRDAHRAYWVARHAAMELPAAGAAIYLRDFEAVCKAAGLPPPTFFQGPGIEPPSADEVPLEAPSSRFGDV